MTTLLEILDKYGLDDRDFACLINELDQSPDIDLNDLLKESATMSEKISRIYRENIREKTIKWFEKSKEAGVFDGLAEGDIDIKTLPFDELLYYYDWAKNNDETFHITNEYMIFSKFYRLFVDDCLPNDAWNLADFLTLALTKDEQTELLKTLENDQEAIDTLYGMYPPSLIDEKVVVPVGNKRFLIDKDIRLDKEQKHTLELLAKEMILQNPVYITIEDGVLVVN